VANVPPAEEDSEFIQLAMGHPEWDRWMALHARDDIETLSIARQCIEFLLYLVRHMGLALNPN
jgi:hypothetical protein